MDAVLATDRGRRTLQAAMFELRHLRYFLAVAEELNFSRAAERLHIAQPALSAQIRTLETQLGCELFARTTRKVELTPNGKILLVDAREIVARADAAAAKMKAAGRGERGLSAHQLPRARCRRARVGDAAPVLGAVPGGGHRAG
jgi:LysR family hca operon transcriptional activator